MSTEDKNNTTVEVDMARLETMVWFCRAAMPLTNKNNLNLDYFEKVIADKKAAHRLGSPLEIGNVVVPLPARNTLRAGTTAYHEVIVINVEPLVVASNDLRYKWDNVSPSQFKVIGQAPDAQIQHLRAVWYPD